MKSSWLLAYALAFGCAFANESAATSPANNQWQDWVTTTVYQVDYKTEYKTSVSVSVSVSVSYVTNYVTVPGPTTTITQTSYVSQAPATVTNTVTNVVPSVVVSTVQSVASVTALVTVTSVRTVANVQTVTQSALSGLVTCESRIVNPTYTTSTPLPSTYLWGCPPGKLCYPPRIGCNFEQGNPAKSYYCKPEDCRPVANIPPANVWLPANQYKNNGTCAFLTPVDDYFNLNPLQFGLNYGIFNIYGQPTCSASTTCPPPKTVTIKNDVTISQNVPVPTTIAVPTTLTVVKTTQVPSPVTVIEEKSTSTWAAWQGTGQPPKVTKRAALEKRQLGGLMAYQPCYASCDYANYKWQSIGNNPDDLCGSGSDYVNAYQAILDCNAGFADSGVTAGIITDLDQPRSICNQPANRKRWGVGNLW